MSSLEYSSPLEAPWLQVDGETSSQKTREVEEHLWRWQVQPHLLELQVTYKRLRLKTSPEGQPQYWRCIASTLASQEAGLPPWTLYVVAQHLEQLLHVCSSSHEAREAIANVWETWHRNYCTGSFREDLLRVCCWITWGIFHQHCMRQGFSWLWFYQEAWFCTGC